MPDNTYPWFARIFRGLVQQRFAQLRHGALTVSDSWGQRTFGDTPHTLSAQVQVNDAQFYQRVALGGGLGAAEALIDGLWSCDDLTSLVRLFIRNMEVSDQLDRGWAAWRWLLARLEHALRRNTRSGSVKNIREHYDLGNDFYRLMLDETMSYSCGYFEHPFISLREASLAKIEKVCSKLALQSHEHLLEIGGGWGGLALHAARHYGCRVTTTTISQQQFEFTQRRVIEAGLQDRITVLRCDYRDLTGCYDKLVSIEMIEAVGHEFLPTFFRQCRQLLKPGGRLVLQAILMKDDRYQLHLRSVDFIRKYIFPGGCLPSRSALHAAATPSGLKWEHEEDITSHYVTTLQRWRENFWQNIDFVRSQGFTERFVTMWHYYLCYCEACFAERQTLTSQFVLQNPGELQLANNDEQYASARQ